MNRLLAITLAAFSIVALAGCGGGDTSPAAATTATGAAASNAATQADTGAESPPVDTGSAGADTAVDEAAVAEITALVEAWYADADPAVCERMTDALLDYGWGATGDAGRAECRTNLEAAAPVADVQVGMPVISGKEAAVAVSYELDGSAQRDGVTLVEIDGTWWLDTVARSG